VEKYGLDVSGEIDTFEELDTAFRTIKAGEGENFYTLNMNNEGFNGAIIDYDGLAAGFPPIGVRIDDESRTVVSVFEQEDVMGDLRILHGWYMDGMINPDAAVVREGPKPNHFLTGQGWPGAEVGWALNSGIEEFKVFQVTDPLYTTGSIQGSLNAISTGSNYKEESLKFLELANLDHKLRDMLAYGIEGTHFEYVSENVVKKLTDTWTLPGYQQATFFTMSTIEGQQTDSWEQVKKLNEVAKSSVCLGFMINMEPINDQLANCRTVWEKYRAELQTGTSDPDVAIPALRKELRANGFDEIMAEAQAQVDAYFQ
jgi:putative aldouronate transport system substrate-binding protein